MEEAVSLDNVCLTLAGNAGPVEVLRGIDLVIGRGERVAITGPSGSGKSSLLMLTGGLERATRGRVRVFGQDLGILDEDRLAAFRLVNMGIVFQSFHLLASMTALENVAMPLELAGRRDAMARARADLAAVGLADRAHHYPSELSGGEQQRVALARALANRPRLLLADEPTGNLDEATGAAVAELMFALAASHGITLVLVTHEAELAGRCDRAVSLRGGRLAGPRVDGPRETAG